MRHTPKRFFFSFIFIVSASFTATISMNACGEHRLALKEYKLLKKPSIISATKALTTPALLSPIQKKSTSIFHFLERNWAPGSVDK